jgi:hypothetical protein
MKILETKTNIEIVQSLIAEAAKSANELKCAKGDLQKIETRLQFILALLNTLQERQD